MTLIDRTRMLASLMVTLELAASGAHAPSGWFARAWQSDEGLPDNTVVGVGQTADGFIWVATQCGLVRFDGLTFQQCRPITTAGAPTSLIQAFLVDREDRLWVATDGRTVTCQDNGQAKVFTAESGLPNLEARSLVEDGEGAIWVSYIGGDEVARIYNGQVKLFGKQDGLPGGGTCQLTTDKTGRLWFAQGYWLGVFRNGKFVALENSACQRIAPARSGGLWCCTGNQLFKYSEGKPPAKVGELTRNLTSWGPNPTVLMEDTTGLLWIGTREAGLFTFDGAMFAAVKTSHQEIRSVNEDREGNIWVGTFGGGLNQIKAKMVELLPMNPQMPYEATRSVCQDSDGLIWVVSQRGSVWRNRGNDWVPLEASEGWPVPYAQCVAADPKGGVWIGTEYKGLHHWLQGRVITSLSMTNGLAGNDVSALLTTSRGEVWIGTASADAQQVSIQCWRSGRLENFGLPSRSGKVAAFSVGASNEIWAATASGLLFRISKDLLKNETTNTLAVPCPIRSLYLTDDGSLWIGYAGDGVGRLKAGRFSYIRRDQGLYDDYISQIVQDDHGRLWFAGNRGIFYVREKELGDFFERRATRVRSIAYGQNEGLPRLQANHNFWPSALHCKDGRLLIPMQSGLAVVHATEFRENRRAPPMIIERVIVNGKTVAAYDPIVPRMLANSTEPLDINQGRMHLRLPPGPKQLQIVFSALSFIQPETIAFRYRMKGLNADWVDGGTQRTVSYAQIPPGDYLFEVTACNRDGIWNESSASLELSVASYWWQTTLFSVFATLLAFGMLGGGIQLAIRRRHRRQIERLEMLGATERERSRIAQDLHDDLGAGLTQISLNTAMVQNPAVDADVSSSLLQEIEQRARDLVTALDEIVWAVNPKNDSVSSLARYFCQYAQSYVVPGGIACRLEVAPVLPDVAVGAEQRHHMFLAFKEALHNILRHSSANEVKIEIHADAEALFVDLTDNGKGFMPGPVPEGADGLGNMRMRLQRLGGTCTVTSAPGAGTRIAFRLPLTANSK